MQDIVWESFVRNVAFFGQYAQFHSIFQCCPLYAWLLLHSLTCRTKTLEERFSPIDLDGPSRCLIGWAHYFAWRDLTRYRAKCRGTLGLSLMESLDHRRLLSFRISFRSQLRPLSAQEKSLEAVIRFSPSF